MVSMQAIHDLMTMPYRELATQGWVQDNALACLSFPLKCNVGFHATLQVGANDHPSKGGHRKLGMSRHVLLNCSHDAAGSDDPQWWKMLYRCKEGPSMLPGSQKGIKAM